MSHGNDSAHWANYAQSYDAMAQGNPAYQYIIGRFVASVSTWKVNSESTIIDVGAGTGNFSVCAASLLAPAKIIHCEPDKTMIDRARSKSSTASIANLSFLQSSAESLAFGEQALDGAIIVHVLYTLKDPNAFIRRLHRWLKPGSRVFACDLGRILDVPDWRRYLYRNLFSVAGFIKGVRLLWKSRVVAVANRVIAANQLSGLYWTHDLESFASAFRQAGFEIERMETAYRGYSDLVVARKTK